MRIVLHDFGGYAFTVQLARWLAARGHRVLHLSAGEIAGPQGPTAPRPGDAPTLSFASILIGRPFARYALHRRLPDEVRYGRRLGAAIGRFEPEVVLSANTPPVVQRFALGAARRQGAAFVNWVHDIFSLGVGAMPVRWSPWLRTGALAALRRLEFGAMADADGLVVIAPDFERRLAENGVAHPLTLVQENWSPSTDLMGRPRDNGWSRAMGLADRRVFLVAGTLGLKHNPALVAALARTFRDEGDVRVVVASQGPGRAALEEVRSAESLPGLLLLDYQPPEQVPDMLAAADVAVTILNRGAGAMSVPSKVYSYAAAGRAILAAVPGDNLAHRLIRDHGLGLAVEPEDEAGFLAAARRLMADASLRAACGAAGAAFAHERCDIDRIGPRFEALLDEALTRRRHADRSGRRRGVSAERAGTKQR